VTVAERRALATALAHAQPAVRRAAPNPGVGCVILADGEVVGIGTTAPPGGPHAERVALAAAGDRARGATACVTLEPCAHHGRTPPCTDALIAAGVARVVVAHPDPNPIASGGIAVLRDAGLEVVGPLPPEDAIRAAVAQQLEGFLHVVRRGRPHLTLKVAQTFDGALVAPDGARWLTGPTARRAVHRWRAARDAVLVGVGTVLADDPRLDVRDVAAVHDVEQPRAVVVDSRLRTPPGANVARVGTLVLTCVEAADPRAAALTARGVRIVTVAPDDDGRVDLRAAMRSLADQGVTSVLAEPGRTLVDALLAADLVDRVVLHVATHLGTGAWRAAAPTPPADGWRTERVGGAGTDLIRQAVRVGGPTPAGAASEVPAEHRTSQS
jgi:diaminohydroxyphosphoribosylaminopyrimidine deaminase / 5-amino-6-(5-phosphoribosylamino)uracil reductase